jgi:hypothetical protein
VFRIRNQVLRKDVKLEKNSILSVKLGKNP